MTCEDEMTVLSLRGQRFIHLVGPIWKSWCRHCGREYTTKVGHWGIHRMATSCEKHRGQNPEGPRHHNARITIGLLAFCENGAWLSAPAPAPSMFFPLGCEVLRQVNGPVIDQKPVSRAFSEAES